MLLRDIFAPSLIVKTANESLRAIRRYLNRRDDSNQSIDRSRTQQAQ
jgi:hypothetical protein